ncbi:MAG: tetratricopeptide repeat protein, partial [Pirellulaceae bacterium]|nr:tetratricopeptide repeat protein [Pirellulaceae bacterium]
MLRVAAITWILLWFPAAVTAENLEFCRRANEVQNAEDYKTAILHYTQCVERGDLSTKNLFLALYNRGNAYLAMGQFAEAIEDYTQATRLDPVHAYAFNNRGNALTRTGQLDRAIQDYDQAIQLAPKDDVPLFNRGNAYSLKKQYDQAIRDFSNAIRLNADNVPAYNNRGNIYRQTGQYDKAILDFDEAIRLHSGNAPAYYNRGVAYAAKRQHDRADQDYSEAIRLDPNSTGAYNGRGRTRFLSGRFDAAINDFKTAIGRQPNDPYAAIWLYLSQARSGRDGRNDLTKNAAPFAREPWPGPIIAMLLGQATVQATIDRASDPDPVRQREKRTEALFYAGQYELLRGSRTDAIGYFHDAVEAGIVHFV